MRVIRLVFHVLYLLLISLSVSHTHTMYDGTSTKNWIESRIALIFLYVDPIIEDLATLPPPPPATPPHTHTHNLVKLFQRNPVESVTTCLYY